MLSGYVIYPCLLSPNSRYLSTGRRDGMQLLMILSFLPILHNMIQILFVPVWSARGHGPYCCHTEANSNCGYYFRSIKLTAFVITLELWAWCSGNY
ncbi:hypothetical protein ASPVEDRAFT_317654 [Aspergillus versicolor CBS 583.65]|uniref:Uncharacterized protein n=1 Tax=Aspergillus versicolor CBS 583.65 TaxID=1036611 RepID=A0A1L9PXL7_ASPVE|nr:uncharacterized protein ASPVEDRAFT_317654 [Aspergillus versicolor CBS 583.65]OJJ06290.1 hypothetical protein ASPVEDRAFT_317654 [Aspergillus versicolor CBS 583.65]